MSRRRGEGREGSKVEVLLRNKSSDDKWSRGDRLRTIWTAEICPLTQLKRAEYQHYFFNGRLFLGDHWIVDPVEANGTYDGATATATVSTKV